MNPDVPDESTGSGSTTAPPTDLNPRRDPPLDFVDRPFGELVAADYAELGFMCGLEVHQQLRTASKLFCRCPAGVRTRKVDAEVLRHMRPTLSELGEYDGCALMEFKKHKEIVYQLSRTCVCTYETDDTPPFEIDEEAVRIAIRVARLFDLSLVSELHVMRKQYLDGSIPTGFQRTAMVGLGGMIPFGRSELGPDRQLRIRQLSLEEDSCREVSDVGHRITFSADRLGMPLVETVTEPDLLTPRDAAAGVELLAAVARISGAVRRGPGAARQDVNVSIAGSRRIEIKGVPSARRVPRLVHNEAFRQLNLLRIRAELQRRGVTAASLTIRPKGLPWEVTDLVVDARSAVKRCDYDPIRGAFERGDMICAVKLPGFGGLLGHLTQPGVPFAHEFSERVRVIACLTARPFLLATDVDEFALDAASWRQLRSALRAQSEDGIVVVWGELPDAATAAREVLLRAIAALGGVPSETRQARPDGTTGFERILPGPERMYPDTDTPPLPVPDEWVPDLRNTGPERPWECIARHERAGLSRSVAERLATAPWSELFDALAPTDAALARRLAAVLEKRLPRVLGSGGTLPEAGRLKPAVAAVEDGRLLPVALEWVVVRLLDDQALDPARAIDIHRPADPKTAAGELAAYLAALTAARPAELGDAATLRWAMGTVLCQFPRGRFDPSAVRAQVIDRLALDATALGMEDQR